MSVSVGSLAQRAWLLLLLAAWAVLLASAYLFAADEDLARGARMASSLALGVAGWSWCILLGDFQTVSFRLLLALGMTLGFVGDLSMAGLLPVRDSVLGGIAAFGCGHLAYIAALLTYGQRHNLTAALPRWGALASWMLIGLVGWLAIVFPSIQPAGLRWAALPYILLLAGTAGCATGLALQARAFRLLALGAGMFLLSDLLVAADHFRDAPAWVGACVWLTYGPGQMLIVYGGNAAVGRGEIHARGI